MSPTRRYLNRDVAEKSEEGLLDLLVRHYDELGRLMSLTSDGSCGKKSRRQAGKVSGPKTATP